jgi:hypothetical protein
MVARVRRVAAGGLRQALDRALPQRSLAVNRAALIDAMLKQIERWKAIEPEIAPHAEKKTRAMGIARSLRTAVERIDAKLKTAGADADIAEAQGRRSADTGIDPAKVGLRATAQVSI